MKKSLLTIIVFFLLLSSNSVFADVSKDEIIPLDTDGSFSTLTGAEGLGAFDALLGFVRDSIFGLIALIFIAMMIYVGVKLFISRGNEEEFSKALWTFMYAVIGMIILLLSYAAVRLIVGLTL